MKYRYTLLSTSLYVTGNNKDYTLDDSSIPRASNDKCEVNPAYRTRFGVCSCNEHCSWDICRLFEPPDDCIPGANSEWKWDNLKNAYVAQIIDGMYDRPNHRHRFKLWCKVYFGKQLT